MIENNKKIYKGKKIVFLSSLIPEEMNEEVSNKMKNGMPDAANLLQWHLIEGLSYNFQTNIDLVNVLPISSYPRNYDDLVIKKERFYTKYGNNNINIGFLNLKGVRNYSIERNVYRVLISMFAGYDSGVLFVYTLSASLLNAIKKFNRIYTNIHVCAIVADLPSMNDLSGKSGFINKLANRILAESSYKNITYVNSFVLLTQQMAEYLQINKPYCIVEGIATILDKNRKTDTDFNSDKDIKTILYTGTLHKKFGILNLVQAFKNTTNENYRLQICGVGDCEDEIIEATKKDARICYLGKVNHDKILELQSAATVLVNPRQNNESFTKYSFPSKNLEYLSSGNPLIAYMLDGIPLEYKNYIISPKDDSIKALTDVIEEICQLSFLERKEIGLKGRDYVTREKNSKKQTKKIMDMINDMREV